LERSTTKDAEMKEWVYGSLREALRRFPGIHRVSMETSATGMFASVEFRFVTPASLLYAAPANLSGAIAEKLAHLLSARSALSIGTLETLSRLGFSERIATVVAGGEFPRMEQYGRKFDDRIDVLTFARRYANVDEADIVVLKTLVARRNDGEETSANMSRAELACLGRLESEVLKIIQALGIDACLSFNHMVHVEKNRMDQAVAALNMPSTVLPLSTLGQIDGKQCEGYRVTLDFKISLFHQLEKTDVKESFLRPLVGPIFKDSLRQRSTSAAGSDKQAQPLLSKNQLGQSVIGCLSDGQLIFIPFIVKGKRVHPHSAYRIVADKSDREFARLLADFKQEIGNATPFSQSRISKNPA